MAWLKRLFWSSLLLAMMLTTFVYVFWQPDRQLGQLLPEWAPAPSKFIELDGMQVHVRDTGPKDDPLPIVLMHVRGGSLHSFEQWQTIISQSRRVITFDLPGFGLTGPNPSGQYQIDVYTRFLLRFLDTLDLKEVVLGGNGLGGEIAWRTAIIAPARVKRLVLIDADGYAQSPLSQPLAFHFAQIKAMRWISERILPESLVAASVRNLYGTPTKVTDTIIRRIFEMNLRVGNRRALFQFMDQQTSGAQQHLIKQIKQPTLVLWGEKDKLVPVEFAYRFCTDITNCTLVRFPQLGHIPEEEAASTTVMPVLKFLNKPDSASNG